MIEKKCPTAESLLSTLIELYADQMGVAVDYEIIGEGGARDVPCSGQLRPVQAT